MKSNQLNSDDLYSYHVFLFPFQWSYLGDKSEGKLFKEKTDPNRFIQMLKGHSWKRQKHTTDTILKYNEATYFYEWVHNVLYDKESIQREQLLSHFEYDLIPETWTYNFSVRGTKEKEGKKQNVLLEYSLLVDSIHLNLYSTGVGVLSFHLNNRSPDQRSKEDILLINQYGRRIYPPFFGIDKDVVGTQEQFEEKDFETGLEMVKEKELPVRVSLEKKNGVEESFIEDFTNNTKTTINDGNTFQLPEHIKKLFEEIPITTNPAETKAKADTILLSPLLDDRMFVVCWYGNDELADEISPDKNSSLYPYKSHNWWCKYIFVDGETNTCQNGEMMRKLIEKHTNARWVNLGTLFGSSRYSFVCLTSDLKTLKNKRAEFLVNHVQTIYSKIFELCLVQRASILRFSKEITDISSGNKAKNHKRQTFADKVSSLKMQYLKFVNKIYFREVTAQDQGIELYDQLQSVMNIGREKDALNEDIQNLFNHTRLQAEQTRQRQAHKLNLIVTYTLPMTLIASFFGINFISDNTLLFSSVPDWRIWISVGFIIVLGGAISILIRNKYLKADSDE